MRCVSGPWTDWSGRFSTPWAPRASAAVSSSVGYTGAWFASGMNFTEGVPGLPAFADAYQVQRIAVLVKRSFNYHFSSFSLLVAFLSCANVFAYAYVLQIDAGVCLISPTTNKVCSGIVGPNLDTVTCDCPPAFRGDPLCGSCTPGVRARLLVCSFSYTPSCFNRFALMMLSPQIAGGVWPHCVICPTFNGAPCGQ
jgi:hypothetical protein